MNVRTICWFLLGRRAAIERIAACPRAVWVGLLFVLSAGLAREYDGEDLLAEPYHAVLPLVASLGTSLLLYVLLSFVARCWHRPGQWWIGYTRFLGLYWMTAPLAWLYAIPVERFQSPLDATITNLYLLAGVSLWRALLMIRVTSVVFRAPLWAAFVLVMLFADGVALLAINVIPHPVMTFMGGIRQLPGDSVVAVASAAVQHFGFLLLPLWIGGTIAATYFRRLAWPDWRTANFATSEAAAHPVSRTAWLLASAFLVAGFALLPLAQREQQRRTQAERMLRGGEVTAAIQYMSQFDRDAFPPHWDPPPRMGYAELEPPLLDVFETMLANHAPEWLWETYQYKLGLAFEPSDDRPLVDGKHATTFARWLAVLEAMPRQRQFADVYQFWLQSYYDYAIRDKDQAEQFRSWLIRNGIQVHRRIRDSVDQRPPAP